MRDTNGVADIGQRELEYFVHVNAARICEVKHGVVGETRTIAHGARDEQTFERNAREALTKYLAVHLIVRDRQYLMTMHNLYLFAYQYLSDERKQHAQHNSGK